MRDACFGLRIHTHLKAHASRNVMFVSGSGALMKRGSNLRGARSLIACLRTPGVDVVTTAKSAAW